MIVPERTRRESSPTALKAVTKTGGLSYPHKGKGATGQGIEDEGQKRSDRGSGAHTHDQCWEAWKTAEIYGVIESGSSSTDRPNFVVRVFGVTVGTGPQFCNGETFGPPI